MSLGDYSEQPHIVSVYLPILWRMDLGVFTSLLLLCVRLNFTMKCKVLDHLSFHLNAVHDPLIVGFGIYGNDLDKVTRSTFTYGFEVHCTTSNDPNITTTDWFFANGTKVGLVSSNFREGHYGNGTTVLQIGINRRLSYCDGGNYTCVVNTTSGRTERRSFRLAIGCKHNILLVLA